MRFTNFDIRIAHVDIRIACVDMRIAHVVLMRIANVDIWVV